MNYKTCLLDSPKETTDACITYLMVIPFLTEIECPTLPDPVNGRINSESTKFRSKATPECDEGYVYSGSDSAVRYCLANRTWTGRAGICQGRYRLTCS